MKGIQFIVHKPKSQIQCDTIISMGKCKKDVTPVH